MPPPSVTDLLQQVKAMVENLDVDNNHTEIELLKQKVAFMLSKEDVRELIKKKFEERDKILAQTEAVNSKWTKPLIQILVVVLTAIVVSYLSSKGFIQ